MLARIALASLWNRRLAVCLTVAGIALSTALIVGVERIRVETKESFTSTIAGTDLIVGARTSPVQLLLYSVFRIGDPTSNLEFASYEKISRHPSVAWSIPLSLGDSHRGFRVLGTTPAYFEHLRHGRDQRLEFATGQAFGEPLEAVIGTTVARELGYALDDAIVIAHGTRDDGLARHDQLTFRVTGILEPSGTPADRTVHVDLAGIEAIHVGWESGAPVADDLLHEHDVHEAHLEPDEITAFFVGLKQRSQVLTFQRAVNGFPDEPLLAILPGVALTELWGLFAGAELALLIVAALTVLTGMVGMVVGIYSTLNERRREMAVMRAVGARPRDIFVLLMAESTLIGVIGALTGYLLLSLTVLVGNATVGAELGIRLSAGVPAPREALLLAAVMAAAFVTGALPAWRAYRLSLHDGLHAGV